MATPDSAITIDGNGSMTSPTGFAETGMMLVVDRE